MQAQHDAFSGPIIVTNIDKGWFQERLRQLKISQRQLAKRIGLDPAAVSYMLQGKRAMSMDEAKAIAEQLLVPVTEVMRQAGIEVLDDVRKVPVTGFIGAGCVVTLLPIGTHDHVMAPSDTPAGSFALQVRMVSSARDGWLYYVAGEQLHAVESVDKLCLVALKDGGMKKAVIKRGYKKDLYNLLLTCEEKQTVLENKEIVWASRVLWIQPV